MLLLPKREVEQVFFSWGLGVRDTVQVKLMYILHQCGVPGSAAALGNVLEMQILQAPSQMY